MIVSCPGCRTRFAIADGILGSAAGIRQLRCAHCGHLWQQPADGGGLELVEPVLPTADASEAVSAEIALAVPVGPPAVPNSIGNPDRQNDADIRLPAPIPFPRPSTASEPPPATYWRGVRLAVLGVSLAAGLVLVAIFGRATIEAWFPSATSIYAMLHLGDAPGTGLKVSVIPMRSADSLVVNGDIVNGAPIARRVPKLRVTLLDGNKSDLDSKVIDPPVAQLRPGATAHFNAIFLHPTTAAVRVNVTFAHD